MILADVDRYGDNFFNAGSGNLDISGDYILQPTLDSGRLVYGIKNDTSQYVAQINSPSIRHPPDQMTGIERISI
jgi:hypothetical protein